MSEPYEDLYGVLEMKVTTDLLPSKSKISRAFRRLALKLHPDKQHSKGLSSREADLIQVKFEAISRANEILQDDERRMDFEKRFLLRREDEKRRLLLDETARILESNLLQKEESIKRKRNEDKTKEQNAYMRNNLMNADYEFKKRYINRRRDNDDNDCEVDTGADARVVFYSNLFKTGKAESIIQNVLGSTR